jgi:hypothetical protein
MTPKSSRIQEIERDWNPEAIWRVSTANEEVSFNLPAFGQGAYDAVIKKVLTNKQRLPTGEQIAFMLDEAYNSKDEAVKNNPRAGFVRDDIIGNALLWVPHVNVWTPNSAENPGMYSVFDEEGEGLSRKYTIEELEDKLSGCPAEREVRFSKDRKVAFAPLKTFASGCHGKKTLSDDGAVRAVYGIGGAEKLDNVANVFPYNPYSFVFCNNSQKLIQTLSALGRRWFSGDGLGADFLSGGIGRTGYVLSVSGSK